MALHALTHARELTDVDSVNLALALGDFDVTRHQPHPPGYPLVVAAAHVFSWLGPVGAYIAVAVAFSGASVIATWALAEELFGEGSGFVAACVVAATPLFLYHGDIVSVYLPEVTFASVVVLLAARVARRREGRADLLLLPALAVAGGFRPSILPLLLPVCAVAAALGRPPPRRLVGGGLAAAVVVALWAVPMVMESQGLGAYLAASSALYREAAEGTSVLYGAPPRAVFLNARLVMGATAMCLLAGVGVLLAAGLRRPRAAERRSWAVLAAWLLPYVALYVLVHIGKPAYVLAYLPALAIAVAGLVADRQRAQRVAGVVVVAVLLAYAALPRSPLPERFAELWPTAAAVRSQDAEARAMSRIARSCPAPSCTVVSLPDLGRTFCRDPASLARWYAPRTRFARPESLDAVPADGELLWVGIDPPVPVRRHATPEPGAGSWEIWRSGPAATRAILAEGVPDDSCPGRPAGGG